MILSLIFYEVEVNNEKTTLNDLWLNLIFLISLVWKMKKFKPFILLLWFCRINGVEILEIFYINGHSNGKSIGNKEINRVPLENIIYYLFMPTKCNIKRIYVEKWRKYRMKKDFLVIQQKCSVIKVHNINFQISIPYYIHIFFPINLSQALGSIFSQFS